MINFLLWLFTPFTKFINKIHMPFSRKKTDSKDYYAIEGHAVEGGVLLSKKLGELTNLFNPDEGLEHAGILHYDSGWKVIEATGEGVIKTDLIDFVMHNDRVCLLLPRFKINNNALYVWHNMNLGKSYDELFKDGDDEFYCYEYVARALTNASIKALLGTIEIKKQHMALGKVAYGYDSFLKSDLFSKVYDSEDGE
jgi:hypothetical protein